MRRTKPRSIGAVLRLCVVVVMPMTQLLFRRDWRHSERIPATGPAIVVANHVSYADPFVMARFTWDAGRLPRFLAKSTLFTVPVVGYILRAAGQIPVRRGTRDAAHSLDDAVSALERGEVVVVYPEGTVTRDPDWWPTSGKTGAARLARLVPDVPVLPVGQWGSQDAVDWYHRRFHLLSRTRVGVSVGEPLNLRTFLDRPETTATLHEMTEVMMAAITVQVAEIRGLTPPSPPPPLEGMPA
ncbi:MAG: lysophospholipid acyltransferase family protein [bacterium]